MTAGVADIADVEGEFIGKFLLDSEVVTVGGGNISRAVRGQNPTRRCQWGSIGESGRDVTDVSAVNGGCIHGGRIADATKVKDILLVALEEHTRTATKRCLPVSEDIVSEAESRTKVVPAEVLPTFWQSVRAFADHAVVGVAGTRNDGTLGRRLAWDIRCRVDRYSVRGVIGTGHEIVLVVLPNCICGPDEFVTKAHIQSEPGSRLPGVLDVTLVLEKVEVTIG